MRFRQIIPKPNTFLLFVTLLCLFSVWSCEPVEDPASGTGALSFNVVYHDGIDDDLRSEPLEAAKIDCGGQGIATIEAKVYDADDNHLADGGPWKCDAREGKISDVPAGNDRTVVVLGKDAGGNVTFRGQKSGIPVNAGRKNNAGTIECNSFVPNLSAPADDAKVRQWAMVLEWEDVAGATKYHVLISQNEDMRDPVIDDYLTTETSHTPSGLTPMITYYWRVYAVDMNGNRGMGSQRSLTVASALPDTDQTYDDPNVDGEDADYTINPPAYTKLDADGNVLPDSKNDWAMVRDERTGLTWEHKTLNDDIHNAEDTYTWQNAQDVFIAKLNNDNFGRYSDWRLPTIKELFAIAHKDLADRAVNIVYFPNIRIARQDGGRPAYWSSNTYVQSQTPAFAWFADFTDGDIFFSGTNKNPPAVGDKRHKNFVIAVRGEPNNCNLEDNEGEETVTDRATGLMWQKHGSDEAKNWEEALDYCRDLRDRKVAGYDDWRLPNINELMSIVNYDTSDSAVYVNFLPDPHSTEYYWSSTTWLFTIDENDHEYHHAWNIDFSDGDIWNGSIASEKTNSCYVRAVRGGQ